MPTITISNPVLTTGQWFEVRYRLLPAGAWVNISPQTNAPFSINGLAAGTYELEATLAYGSPATLCDETTITFTVDGGGSPCECLTVSFGEIFENNGLAYIHLQYSLPSPEPPCGWKVIYTHQDGSNPVQLLYSTLPPADLYILLPQPLRQCYKVYVIKDCCDDGFVTCYSAELCRSIPPCIPATFTSVQVLQQNGWWLKIVINNSAPPMTNIPVSYYQANALSSGLPDSGNVSFVATAGSNIIMIPINPNLNLSGGNFVITYVGTVSDGCGGTLKFDISLAT